MCKKSCGALKHGCPSRQFCRVVLNLLHPPPSLLPPSLSLDILSSTLHVDQLCPPTLFHSVYLSPLPASSRLHHIPFPLVLLLVLLLLLLVVEEFNLYFFGVVFVPPPLAPPLLHLSTHTLTTPHPLPTLPPTLPPPSLPPRHIPYPHTLPTFDSVHFFPTPELIIISPTRSLSS